MKTIQHILISSILVAVLGMGLSNTGLAQTGYDPNEPIIFEPVVPLLEDTDEATSDNSWGFELLFSQSGFGFGMHWTAAWDADWYTSFAFGINGARNSDEFEVYDEINNRIYVPNKVNRLYNIPITYSVLRRVFRETLTETLRPYLQAGVGASVIVASPYDQEFFSSFGDADTFVRPAAFFGVGAWVGDPKVSLTSVNIRYYSIPFGGDGLESIRDLPIENFGGVFLSLNVGFPQ